MATSFWFNGKKVILPGVYSTIKSGITNPLRDLDYGRILLIDTGVDTALSQSFGSGPGINGTLTNGSSPVQEFDNVLDFRTAIGGGLFWAAASFLFKPKGIGIPGISKLYYVKAATTVAAEMTFTPTGGGAAGGSVVLQVRNEGVVGNGVLSGTELAKGYAFILRAGKTSGKFVLDMYRGNFRGNNGSGGDLIAWDGVEIDATTPSIVVSTPEFATLGEVQSWMNTNVEFQTSFEVKSFTITDLGTVTAADAVTYADYTLAISGTDTYATTDLDDALTAVTDLDYTYILSDVYGGAAVYQSTPISTILAHIVDDAKYEKYIIIGGGKDSTEFNQATDSSIATAEDNDTSRVVVVHGDFLKSIKVSTTTGSNVALKQYESFFKAANVLGRILGAEPQVPGTFKTLDIDGEVHELNKDEKEEALQDGVLVTGYDVEFGDFTIIQSINSLQDNDFLVNPDGQSFTIEIERIKSQLNKELVVLAKQRLLGQRLGVNRNTLSANDVKLFTEGYLQGKIADQTDDNLILAFQNVTVTTVGDAYQIAYEFMPNFPVSKLFFTGTMIEI